MSRRGPLELSPAEMRDMVEKAMNQITGLIEALPDAPVDTSPTTDPEFIRSLIEPLPDSSTPLADLLELIFDRGATTGLNPISPGFMGYVPGGGLFHSAVADLIADTVNQYVAVGTVSPVMNQIEANVVRWMCEIIGYPDQARGFLTSGGSMATLSAMITARHVLLGEDFLDGVIYASNQVHHCVNKAAALAGFPRFQFRMLPVDEKYRLNPAAVAEAMEEDRDRGLRPFMIVGSAGTVNTGTVDPLLELSALAKESGVWFHVDAAYGGLFRLTDRGKKMLHGIEDADSVVVDPHKTLFLPYGTGSLLVRNGRHLSQTHGSTADYLPVLHDTEGDVWDFCELSPELTRPFRGLRVWLPLKLHGSGVFRQYLDEKLDLARWVQDRISEIPQLEILARADLSILAFAVTTEEESVEARNRRTRQLLQRVNCKNRVHLTGTMLNGVFAIRVAVVAYRTHREQVEMLISDLTASLEEMTGAKSMGPR